MTFLERIARNWSYYFFKPAPFFDLAVCRIIIISFQIFHMLRNNYIDKIFRFSLLPDYLYHPLPVLRILLFPFEDTFYPGLGELLISMGVIFISGILALLGIKTNLTLIIFSMGNIFIQSYFYSFGIWCNSDALMMITLLIFSFSPVGNVLSIDNLGNRLHADSKKANQKAFTFNPIDSTGIFAKWSLLLIRWIFALIYLDSALSKLNSAGIEWMNGYTLQYYLVQYGLQWNSKLGFLLGQNHTICWILSWWVILFEGTFFLILIYPKLTWIYIIMGFLFHLGVYFTMGLPFFQFIFIYSVFIPWLRMTKNFQQVLKKVT